MGSRTGVGKSERTEAASPRGRASVSRVPPFSRAADPGWYHEFICPSPSTCQTIHQAQLGAPVRDTHEVCGRRCFLPFALIRRPPTSDILIAVCRVAFAHVIAVDHRRPGSWSLVE